MKQRKKIKYVEKQPPDKQSIEQKETQPAAKKEERQTNNQAYLIPKKDHQPSQYKPKYLPKEQKNNQRGKDLQAPRFVERQSSRHDMGCIICSEQIKRKEWIWTCTCCCISMHLKCIKEWIRNVNQQLPKQAQHIFNWKCPQCNFQYNEPLPKYYCFCGKHLNPELDRDLLPHSCGQICDKKRGIYCTHPCPLMCHAGKCPPCEHEGTIVKCQCGKSQRMVRCSQDRLVYQCGKKCEKTLNCNKHKCQRNCHPGACQPCKKKKMSGCFCGKNTDIIDCIQTSYSCGQVCAKNLDCGYHKCEEKCHVGKCNPCPHTPELQTTCPCGKYTIEMLTGDPDFRQSCADPIPICGMPCGRKLDCGHLCPNSCHEGRCPPCKKVTDQLCQCGSQSRKIECCLTEHNPFKCEQICKKKRQCGNHLCNEPCCPHRNSPVPADHPCDLNCTRMLNCGKHECGEPCHIGLCKKCPVIYSQPQPCPCGRTFLKPPIICGTLVPECESVCDKELSCGHRCKMFCHYGPCKCIQEVTVDCRCGKEKINTVCGREALCLNFCKETLACGHKCGLQCHRGTCQEAHKTHPCRKTCNKERKDCRHFCPQLCHDQQCEDFPCEAQILVKCDCGHRQTMTLCGALENKRTRKTIVCNKKCENLKRFDFFYKDKEIYYPGQMVQFAFKNYPYLQNLEAKLERFILHSEENFLQVEYKFQDHSTKLLLIDLFENHYHLNTHFYSRLKHSAFTLMQAEDTMVPKPVLSEYIKLISSGKIKQNNLPFQFTISFQMEQKDKGSLIIKSLKNYLHKYYSERSGKYISLHFWSKQVGEQALSQLEEEFQMVQFRCGYNITKPEQTVGQEQIMEHQEQLGADQSQPARTRKIKPQEPKNTVLEVKQEKPKNEELQSEEQEESQSGQTKAIFVPEPLVGKKIPTTTDSKPKLIVRRGIPAFKKNDYPPSKQNVQDIYPIDQEQLFDEKLDWDKFVEGLCAKNMGPQATQWRIRCLLIINSFHPIQEKYFHQLFSCLVSMYNKDKEAAMRILQIQRIDNKSVKSEMESNGIYLSHHEPEMLSYLRLFNYLAEEKTTVEFPQILGATPEFTKAQDIIESVHQKDPKQFYDLFNMSDFVYSCALIPIVHALRENIIEDIAHGGKHPVKDMYKHLLFESEQELLNYFQKNGLKMGTRITKSTKEEIYIVREGELNKEMIEDKAFIDAKVKCKRDKKYFLHEPEELYQEKYCTLSFFAFGDFKESIIQGYMNSLVKFLKAKE